MEMKRNASPSSTILPPPPSSAWQVGSKISLDAKWEPLKTFVERNLRMWHYDHQLPQRASVRGMRYYDFCRIDVAMYHTTATSEKESGRGVASASPVGTIDEIAASSPSVISGDDSSDEEYCDDALDSGKQKSGKKKSPRKVVAPSSSVFASNATAGLRELAFFLDHMHTHLRLFLETLNRQFPTKSGPLWNLSLRPRRNENAQLEVHEKRMRTLRSRRVRRCLTRIWASLPKDHRGFVSQETHAIVFSRWFDVVGIDVVDEEMKISRLQQDWTLRADGRPALDGERFAATMLCTMDVWCETSDPLEFEEFTQLFLLVAGGAIRQEKQTTSSSHHPNGGSASSILSSNASKAAEDSSGLVDGKRQVQDLMLRSFGRRNIVLHHDDELEARSPRYAIQDRVDTRSRQEVLSPNTFVAEQQRKEQEQRVAAAKLQRRPSGFVKGPLSAAAPLVEMSHEPLSNATSFSTETPTSSFRHTSGGAKSSAALRQTAATRTNPSIGSFATASLVSFVMALTTNQVPRFDTKTQLDRRTEMTMRIVHNGLQHEGGSASLAGGPPRSLLMHPTPAIIPASREPNASASHSRAATPTLSQSNSMLSPTLRMAKRLLGSDLRISPSHSATAIKKTDGVPRRIRATVKPSMEEEFLDKPYDIAQRMKLLQQEDADDLPSSRFVSSDVADNDEREGILTPLAHQTTQSAFSIEACPTPARRRSVAVAPLTPSDIHPIESNGHLDSTLSAAALKPHASGSAIAVDDDAVSDGSVEEAVALVNRHYEKRKSHFQEERRRTRAQSLALMNAAGAYPNLPAEALSPTVPDEFGGARCVSGGASRRTSRVSFFGDDDAHNEEEDEDEDDDYDDEDDEDKEVAADGGVSPATERSPRGYAFVGASAATSTNDSDQGSSFEAFTSKEMLTPTVSKRANDRMNSVFCAGDYVAFQSASKNSTLAEQRAPNSPVVAVDTVTVMQDDTLLRKARRDTLFAAAASLDDDHFHDRIRAFVEELSVPMTAEERAVHRNLFLHEDLDYERYCPLQRVVVPIGLLKGLKMWRGPMHTVSNDLYEWFRPKLYGIESAITLHSLRRFANPYLIAFLMEPSVKLLQAKYERAKGQCKPDQAAAGAVTAQPLSNGETPPIVFRWYYEKHRTDDKEGQLPSSSPEDWVLLSDAHSEFLTRMWVEGNDVPLPLPEAMEQLIEVDHPVKKAAPQPMLGFDYSKIKGGKVMPVKLCADLTTWRFGFVEPPKKLYSSQRRRQTVKVPSAEGEGGNDESPTESEDPVVHVTEGHRLCARHDYLWEYANSTKTTWLPFPLEQQWSLTQWLATVKEYDKQQVAKMSAALHVPGYTPAASLRARSVVSSHRSKGSSSIEHDPCYDTIISGPLIGLHRFNEHQISLSDGNVSMAMTSWVGPKHITVPIRYHVLFFSKEFSVEPLRLPEEWTPAPVLKRKFLESRLLAQKTPSHSTGNSTPVSSPIVPTVMRTPTVSVLGNAPLASDPFQRDKPAVLPLKHVLESSLSHALQKALGGEGLTSRHGQGTISLPLSPDNENVVIVQDTNKPTSDGPFKKDALSPECALLQTNRHLLRDPTAAIQAKPASMRSVFTDNLSRAGAKLLSTKALAPDDTVRTIDPPQPVQFAPRSGFQGKGLRMGARGRTGGGMATSLPESMHSLAKKGKAGLDAAVVEASFGLDLLPNDSDDRSSSAAGSSAHNSSHGGGASALPQRATSPALKFCQRQQLLRSENVKIRESSSAHVPRTDTLFGATNKNGQRPMVSFPSGDDVKGLPHGDLPPPSSFLEVADSHATPQHTFPSVLLVRPSSSHSCAASGSQWNDGGSCGRDGCGSDYSIQRDDGRRSMPRLGSANSATSSTSIARNQKYSRNVSSLERACGLDAVQVPCGIRRLLHTEAQSSSH